MFIAVFVLPIFFYNTPAKFIIPFSARHTISKKRHLITRCWKFCCFRDFVKERRGNSAPTIQRNEFRTCAKFQLQKAQLSNRIPQRNEVDGSVLSEWLWDGVPYICLYNDWATYRGGSIHGEWQQQHEGNCGRVERINKESKSTPRFTYDSIILGTSATHCNPRDDCEEHSLLSSLALSELEAEQERERERFARK